MKLLFVLLSCAALAGCGSPQKTQEKTESSPKYSASGAVVKTYEDVEPLSGQSVTVTGIFSHIRGTHGCLELEGGLYIYIPHIDLFLRGQDWFKYLGKRCTATGILHTYTKDIEGYRGPSIDISGFQGPEP